MPPEGWPLQNLNGCGRGAPGASLLNRRVGKDLLARPSGAVDAHQDGFLGKLDRQGAAHFLIVAGIRC